MKEQTQPSSAHAASKPAGLRLEYASRSEAQTEAFARAVARHLFPGALIALAGDLGSGKTCFVRGLAGGLGIPAERVRSPSFTLVNEYSGGRTPLYHIDLYRLGPRDVDTLALREYLYGDGICAVEWFERLGEQPPHLAIRFTFVAESERALVAVAHGRRYDEVLHVVAADLRGRNDGTED
jgi:tRNA threonylcarbamoyladenosine biosynthesis protein TsaE